MDKIYHETASALHSEHPLAREKLAKKGGTFAFCTCFIKRNRSPKQQANIHTDMQTITNSRPGFKPSKPGTRNRKQREKKLKTSREEN